MTVRTFFTLLAVLVASHLLDSLVTFVGIRHGIPEDNPINSAVLANGGLLGMDLLKLICVALVVWLLWRVRRRYRPWQIWLATLCMTVPALAVAVMNALTIRGS